MIGLLSTRMELTSPSYFAKVKIQTVQDYILFCVQALANFLQKPFYFMDIVRQADAIVRQLSEESGFDREVWQFPVVLIPIGADDRPDSVVLRPIHSVDGMTAQVVRMPRELLHGMLHELLAVNGVCGVFNDLTHKPPGTIEWE